MVVKLLNWTLWHYSWHLLSSGIQFLTTALTFSKKEQVHNSSFTLLLDALLEDLQTSVSRPSSSAAMNGITTPGSTRTYREVTARTIQHDAAPGYQVQYLSPANPTTVVSERASSPRADVLVSALTWAFPLQLLPHNGLFLMHCELLNSLLHYQMHTRSVRVKDRSNICVFSVSF